MLAEARTDSQNTITIAGSIFGGTLLDWRGKVHTPEAARVGLFRIDESIGKELPGEDTISELETILSPVAHVCKLTWCIKHYGPTIVINGILNEPLPSQSPEPTELMSLTMVTADCPNSATDDDTHSSVSETGYSDSDKQPNHEIYLVIQGDSSKLEALGAQIRLDDLLLVSCFDLTTVSQETDSFLVSYDEHVILGYVQPSRCWSDVSNILSGNRPREVVTNAWVLYSSTLHKMVAEGAVTSELVFSANGQNITLTMENIARSLTNQIRSGPRSRNLTGKVLRTEVYMKVQWQWLAYPAALLLLVCTRRDNAYICLRVPSSHSNPDLTLLRPQSSSSHPCSSPQNVVEPCGSLQA